MDDRPLLGRRPRESDGFQEVSCSYDICRKGLNWRIERSLRKRLCSQVRDELRFPLDQSPLQRSYVAKISIFEVDPLPFIDKSQKMLNVVKGFLPPEKSNDVKSRVSQHIIG